MEKVNVALLPKPIKWKLETNTQNEDGNSGFVMTWAHSIEEAERMEKMSWQELKEYLTKRDGEEPMISYAELKGQPTD